MAGFFHFVFGFGIGLLLMVSTRGRFSNKHLFIFAFTNYIGPDFGTIFWFFLGQKDGVSNLFGTIILELFHTLHGWALMSLIYAIIAMKFSEYNLIKNNKNVLNIEWVKREDERLNFLQCYELCYAGGVFHLFIDILSHKGNRIYEWYISTGSWDGNYITWFFIPYGIIWIVVFYFGYIILSAALDKPENIKVIYMAILLSIATFIFALLLFYAKFILGWPAIGEEADAGLIFLFAVYFFLPFVLLVHSYNKNEMKNWEKIEEDDLYE